jgi:hypothetical protein
MKPNIAKIPTQNSKFINIKFIVYEAKVEKRLERKK